VSEPPPSSLRYEPLVKLATGGMATVFVGASRGALGFRQIVAIKRPHPHLVEDPEFREVLLAEARVASRIHHANVVDVRDVEVVGPSVQLVMDYVEGASLGQLIAVGARSPAARMPPGVAVRIVLDACAGLHAAHELCDESGAPLGLIHRDVSPQNLLVGLDGVARVTDFGVAKEARGNRAHTTDGSLKGKSGYFAPEYVRGRAVDRRADVFALGVVLWEALAHKRLFRGANEAESLDLVLREPAPPVSAYAAGAGTALDAVVARAVAKSPEDRFPSALAFADALEAAARAASLVAGPAEVALAVSRAAGDEIAERRQQVREKLAAAEEGALAPIPGPATGVEVGGVGEGPPPRRRVAILAAVVTVVVAATSAAMGVLQRAPRSVDPLPAATVAPPPEMAVTVASAPASLEAPAPRPSAEPRPERPRSSPSAGARKGVKPLPSNPYR
jgi:serine/threonine-protein kinase